MPRADTQAGRASPPRLVVDPDWGYRRLEQLPAIGQLDRFYESHYRDLLDEGGRAPDLTRLVGSGPDADRERAWLRATLHADVVDALVPIVCADQPCRSLDIGCGTGDLVRAMADAGWEAIGIEPAREIARVGQAAGLPIHSTAALEYLAERSATSAPAFDAITLLNVLEHVPDPVALLRESIAALAPGGRLVLRVPNDFNPLQLAAQAALGYDPWWVVVPDHINYFDHASITGLIERLGLELVDRSADFPMELFLLMGDDYVGNPALGPVVHERRRRHDLALGPEVRRRIGRAWAAAGIGRNVFAVARRPTS
jgi:2-polyprenyl-3-methyl-5-hydroxy-6-metoxy-1,4-benzoquinol methylase